MIRSTLWMLPLFMQCMVAAGVISKLLSDLLFLWLGQYRWRHDPPAGFIPQAILTYDTLEARPLWWWFIWSPALLPAFVFTWATIGLVTLSRKLKP